MIEVTKPRAIALGYFDGVHLGHRALMQRAVERAKQIGGTSAVFTFDVHPDSVVMGRQVPLLTANAYRTEEIKKLGGVDEVIFGHFDHEMQHMDWRDFIHKLLIGRFNAGWIISGRNNRFGYKGQGNAEGMAIECEKAGIGYDCIEDVKIDGIVVSSTYIRQLISQGDMEGAAKFLGHPYTVSGIVEHGRRVGTSVSLTDDPVKEVYAAKAILKAVGRAEEGINVVSCPTCGRTRINLIDIAKEVEQRCQSIRGKKMKVAVLIFC